ncbi:hypothetical protein Tco_1284890 [Tanacetum coccineum]
MEILLVSTLNNTAVESYASRWKSCQGGSSKLNLPDHSSVLMEQEIKTTYSTSVRKFVADFLHVPPNRYSPRLNVMKQYRSSIIWCGWLLPLLLCFSSTVLHLLLFLGSYIIVPESAQDTDIGTSVHQERAKQNLSYLCLMIIRRVRNQGQPKPRLFTIGHLDVAMNGLIIVANDGSSLFEQKPAFASTTLSNPAVAHCLRLASTRNPFGLTHLGASAQAASRNSSSVFGQYVGPFVNPYYDNQGRQMELLGDETDIVPLYYHIVDNIQIQFGREEFCLITGLRFGVEYWADYTNEDDPIIFRRRVFSSAKYSVPDWILRLANDRDGWDKYPWGSYVWSTLYSQLRDANVRRWPSLYANEPRRDVDKKTYSIFGFTWAFKEQKRAMDQKLKKKAEREEMDEKMRKFMQDMSVGPMRQANKGPIIVDQHYGLSDFSAFQSMVVRLLSQRRETTLSLKNILNRARREARPSMYRRTSYMDLPPTTVLPKKHGDKTKNKGKNSNVSPLNLGNAFAHDNVGEDDVMIMALGDEDRVRQLAIMNLGHQFDNACTAKDELRKAYEEYRDIPIEQRALIENFLKIESELDYAMQNALFRKAAKLEKQIIDKNQWLQQL